MHYQLITLTLLLAAHDIVCSANGYHYDRPTKAPQTVYHPRNGFLPLSTVVPLPPLPELPPLPTPPPSTHIETHSQILHHVPQPAPTAKSIAAGYYYPQAQYIAPTASAYLSHPQQYQQQQSYQQRPQPAQQSNYGHQQEAHNYGYTAPSAPATNNGQLQAVAQPLRIPYGKQALINYPATAPGNTFFPSSGAARPLKQYAVVEIIDNDIEQQTGPFLSSTPFIDSYRARVGASGTGAIPAPAAGDGIQLDSRANSLVLEQQRLSANLRPAPGDAIALGSGGLGFVRLANGNIYLGSGSLGYISGQQHYQSVNEARTRSGAPTPDALHFGHGPLSTFNSNALYRYK